MSKRPSENNAKIAKYIRQAMGAPPAGILEHWDRDRRGSVMVARFDDVPEEGALTWATANLSDHPLMFRGKEYETRLELVCAAWKKHQKFGDAMIACALNIINDQWFAAPGEIYEGVVAAYPGLSKTLKHVMFVPPYIWEDQLKTLQVENYKVSWLMVIPISEAERKLADKKNPSALMRALEENDVDIFDLDRKSAV